MLKRFFYIWSLMFCLPLLGSAQMPAPPDTTLKIEYVVTDEAIPGYLNINIRAMLGDTFPTVKYLRDSLMFFEGQNKTSVQLDVQKIVPQRFDIVTMIVDVSSSMWRIQNGHPVYMDSAKSIVDTLLTAISSAYAVDLYTYDEELYKKTITGESAMRNVKRPATARYTHLFENISTALGRMADSKGKKLLIVIGDGENDHNRRLETKVTREQLLAQIEELDESYCIFPIALGPKIYENNLLQLVNATKNRDDYVIHGWPGPDLYRKVEGLDTWPSTHRILVKSEMHPHIGDEREIVARLRGQTDTTMYRVGGLFDGWNEQSDWQFDVFGGGILILLLFAAFAFLVPRRQYKDFRKKYVKPYWEVKTEGTRRYDPLTKFPFRDDDLVVVRCEHMTSLETWQYEGRKGGGSGNNTKRGNRCIYYPNKCESGHGPGGSADFFYQLGIFKQLMWVFLGALGGFLGWAAWALFETTSKTLYPAMVNQVSAWPQLQADFGIAGLSEPTRDSLRMVRERVVEPFFDHLIIAALASMLIVFLIAIANESVQARGSFRGMVMVRGILRSVLRALVAGLVGIVIFAGMSVLQAYVFTQRPYLPGLLAMILLGMLLARILTIRSGIRHLRGMAAGFLAGFVAFHVYYLPIMLFHARGNELPKMFAFISFGAILALILSRGSPPLEASEMEVWTRRKRYGKVHITDLLRKNEEVSIGRGPTATVRMKVRHTLAVNAPANITQTFARLTMRNEVVYIEPEIFTEINGEPVAPNERRPLFDGDKIEFKHRSPSHLRYVEHRAGAHPRRRIKRRLMRRKARSIARSQQEATASS